MKDTIFFFIMFMLACIGVYHIIEEVLWQVHKLRHPEDVENMMDYMESVKKK